MDARPSFPSSLIPPGKREIVYIECQMPGKTREAGCGNEDLQQHDLHNDLAKIQLQGQCQSHLFLAVLYYVIDPKQSTFRTKTCAALSDPGSFPISQP